MVAVSYKIFKKYHQNLKYNVKKLCISHLLLVGILSILQLSINNSGGVGVLLNGQNLLNVTKFICQQSLTIILMIFAKNLFLISSVSSIKFGSKDNKV